MGAAASLLGILVAFGRVTPWTLLIITFLLGTGSAFLRPAWLSAVPLLVVKQDVPCALTLNSMSFNCARIVGPAIAALVIGRCGVSALFLFNGISFLGLVIVFFHWQRRFAAQSSDGPVTMAELLAQYRGILLNARLRALLWRTVIAFFGSAAIWPFLPLAARDNLSGGAGTFGTLVTILGAGAIIGGFVLILFHVHFSTETLLALATILIASLLLALATCRSLELLGGWLVLGGAAWITLVSTLNRVVLDAVPEGTRAKAVGLYVVAFSGGQALGSLFWGAVATAAGLRTTLVVAAAFVTVSLPARRIWHLDASKHPSMS